MSNANEKRSLPRHALRWLQTEIDFWLANNHIDAETASRLRALYAESPDASTSEKAPSPDFPRSAPRDFGRILVFATATLGALALGIALYFVFAQIWTDLANSAKIAILLGSLALSYVGAFAARTFKRPNFSAALFFLGAFVFGLSVWQFAEIFRFEIKFPTAYWLWGLAAFGVAFFGDRAATHYLAVGILAVWTVGEIALDEPTAFSPTRFCDFLPGGAYSLPIFAALGYRWGVRRGASGVSLLYALLGVFWASLQPAVWLDGARFPDFAYPFYFIFLGGFVYFVGAKIVRDPFVAAKLRFLGGATVFVLLSIATRRALYEHDFSDYDGCRASSLFATPEFWGSLVFFAVFGAVALTAFLGALRRRRDLFATRSDRRAVLVSPTGIALLLIPTFLLALFGPTPEDADVSLLATLAAVWANVVAVGAAVVCFLVGAFRSARLYWFGVSYFLIWLTFRYFSFDIDDAGTAALFFGIVAISLFGAALFLARLRKNSTPRTSRPTPPTRSSRRSSRSSPPRSTLPKPTPPRVPLSRNQPQTPAAARLALSRWSSFRSSRRSARSSSKRVVRSFRSSRSSSKRRSVALTTATRSNRSGATATSATLTFRSTIPSPTKSARNGAKLTTSFSATATRRRSSTKVTPWARFTSFCAATRKPTSLGRRGERRSARRPSLPTKSSSSGGERRDGRGRRSNSRASTSSRPFRRSSRKS